MKGVGECAASVEKHVAALRLHAGDVRVQTYDQKILKLLCSKTFVATTENSLFKHMHVQAILTALAIVLLSRKHWSPVSALTSKTKLIANCIGL